MSAVSLREIGQISVRVHDLESAITFYRDTLGMPFLFEVPGMAFFDCSGVRLMLSLPHLKEFDHPGSVIYYRVEDLPSAFRELSNRGVEFRAEPHRVAQLADHDLWMAFLYDNQGNTLALMSEQPRG